MSSQGATLQNYNNELVKCLEDLREKRETLNKEVCFRVSLLRAARVRADDPVRDPQILKEEKKKQDIQKKLHKLTEELHRITERLAKKTSARNDFDTTIQETEGAYMKILESSQTLLHVLKRESVTLSKKKQTSHK